MRKERRVPVDKLVFGELPANMRSISKAGAWLCVDAPPFVRGVMKDVFRFGGWRGARCAATRLKR